jgi:hypothetical protein
MTFLQIDSDFLQSGSAQNLARLMALEDPVALEQQRIAELKAQVIALEQQRMAELKAQVRAEQAVVAAGGAASSGFWVRSCLLDKEDDEEYEDEPLPKSMPNRKQRRCTGFLA